jgi:hypothetical protein
MNRKSLQMEKKEFYKLIKDNPEKSIRSLTDELLELDYQINRRKDELDLLPTKEDRIRKVMEILNQIRIKNQKRGVK